MSVPQSLLLDISHDIHRLTQLARSTVSNEVDFNQWTSRKKSVVRSIRSNMNQLQECHVVSLSISLTRLHDLPTEILISILEYVIFEHLFLRWTHVATQFRLVCSKWNKLIQNHPPFLRSIVFNTLRTNVQLESICKFPIDFAWFINNGEECDLQAVNLRSSCDPTIGLKLRSLHLIFDHHALPSASTCVVRSLQEAFRTPSMLSVTHLDLVDLPQIIQFPPLNDFTQAETLVLRCSSLPFVHSQKPISFRHIYLQQVDIPCPSESLHPIVHPFASLLAQAKDLVSLRLDDVRYAGDHHFPPQDLGLYTISPVLERLEVSIVSVSSLSIALSVLQACSPTIKVLSIFLCGSPAMSSGMHKVTRKLFTLVCGINSFTNVLSVDVIVLPDYCIRPTGAFEILQRPLSFLWSRQRDRLARYLYEEEQYLCSTQVAVDYYCRRWRIQGTQLVVFMVGHVPQSS
jgi:hypothetical protein